MKEKMAFLLVFCAVSAVVVSQASADLSMATSQARVTFAQDGSNLIVTLENISPVGVMVPVDVLTGVFFNLPGVTLTPVSAFLAPGSSVLFPSTGIGVDSNGQIGGEYGYVDGLTGMPSGANMVISAVGLDDIVGPPDLFPGGLLWDPKSPNGLGYGIVNGIDPDGNAKVSGAVPLVQSGVVFTLSGLLGPLDLESNISGVTFNYGTEFNPNPIPAPGAILLGSLGLCMVGWWQRRKA